MRSPTDDDVINSFRNAIGQPNGWVKIAVFSSGSFYGSGSSPVRSTNIGFDNVPSLTKNSIINTSIEKMKAMGMKGGNIQSLSSIQSALKSQLATPAQSNSDIMTSTPTPNEIEKDLQSIFASCSEYVASLNSVSLEERESALSTFRLTVLKGFKHFLTTLEQAQTESSRAKRPRSPTPNPSDTQDSSPQSK